MTTGQPDPTALSARAAAAARFREELTRLRVVTHSPDHQVRATTGPGGVTIGLSLTDGALTSTAEQLASTILATLRTGVAEVARRTVALTEDILGGGDPTVLAMMKRHLADLDGSTALQVSNSEPREAGWSSLTEGRELMGADGFSVVTADLRTAADGMSAQLDTAEEMVATAGRANLPQDSWGLLGNAVGLYAVYCDLVDAANDHVGKVKSYLEWAKDNLSGTASAYDEADQQVAQSLPKMNGAS